MDGISEAAKLKACELATAEPGDGIYTLPNIPHQPLKALARYIQQVSDACKEAWEALDPKACSPTLAATAIKPFILPDPVDPLIDALREQVDKRCDAGIADNLREALAKRGLKIVEADQ